MKTLLMILLLPIKFPLGILGTVGLFFLLMGADGMADDLTRRSGYTRIHTVDPAPVGDAFGKLWAWVFKR